MNYITKELKRCTNFGTSSLLVKSHINRSKYPCKTASLLLWNIWNSEKIKKKEKYVSSFSTWIKASHVARLVIEYKVEYITEYIVEYILD